MRRTDKGGRLLRLAVASSATLLIAAVPASAKTLDRAVLVGADGSWIRVEGTASDFGDLARDPGSKFRRVRGGFVRLYFVGRNDFPANRARYYPGQRCIALDWPTYQLCAVAHTHTAEPRTRTRTSLARVACVS